MCVRKASVKEVMKESPLKFKRGNSKISRIALVLKSSLEHQLNRGSSMFGTTYFRTI